ncbi:MAG: hypothetical protein QM766_01405 [Burkholderiaceae bacterium]
MGTLQRTALSTMAALLLGGCATSVPVSFGDKDTEARLKRMEPIPGKVSLYMCRPDGTPFSSAMQMTGGVDGTRLGTIEVGQFTHASIAPGPHEVYAILGNPKGNGISGKMSIDAQAGEIVYVWVGRTGGGLGAFTVDKFNKPEDAQACIRDGKYTVAIP